MKLAYFGTPQFAADFLQKILTDSQLKEHIKVSLVVTQPDKPVGRRQILTPSPVKVFAKENKIEVQTALPKALNDIDLALVYAYGRIIPANLLAMPRHGFWNIHPSLLPKYRGASPTAYPLLNGDTVTGVSLMQMDEKMDHGPIIAQEKYDIKPHDKRPDLERELTDMGYELFKNHVIPSIVTESHAQDHNVATFTKLLKKDDGFIPLNTIRSALETNGVEVYNKFRGLYPWPGIWTKVGEKRMKITDCTLIKSKLVIKKVQLEGKNEIDFNASIINV